MDLHFAFGTLVLLVALALVFDFMNGFHDAANSIATVVSTGVLRPYQAVIWAAFFNFVAAFGFGVHVAKTMGSGLVHLDMITPQVILAGLIGAIVWDLITWRLGLPVSEGFMFFMRRHGSMIAPCLPNAEPTPNAPNHRRRVAA